MKRRGSITELWCTLHLRIATFIKFVKQKFFEQYSGVNNGKILVQEKPQTRYWV